MRLGLTVGLLALVTLKASLLDELLRLGAKVAIVTVGQLPLLGLIDRVPFETHVHSACQTNFTA